MMTQELHPMCFRESANDVGLRSFPGAQRVQDRILNGIAVVCAPLGELAKAMMVVEGARGGVRCAHFKQKSGATVLFPLFNQRVHEAGADAAAAKLFGDDHVFDFPFPGSDACADKTANSVLAFGDKKASGPARTLEAACVMRGAPMGGKRSALLQGEQRREIFRCGGANGKWCGRGWHFFIRTTFTRTPEKSSSSIHFRGWEYSSASERRM